MSSSYKQKKLKTLATRKKTRKRKMQLGMTYEDESGRLFQPPSRRDPRWKKQDVVEVVRAAKKQRVDQPRLGDTDDDDDDDDDELEIVQAIASDVDEDSDESEDEQPVPEQPVIEPIEKPIVQLRSSLDDCVAAVVTAHKQIRKNDGRQKARVLILADAPSLVKALKVKLGVKAEPAKSKSRLGVRSGGDKKVPMAYRHVGPLKTPMDKFKDANEDVLKDFKVGKLPTLLAEDVSYYPYSNLAMQHVLFVAKSIQSVINLDRTHLMDVKLQTIVLNEKGTALSADDRNRLTQIFEIAE